MIFGGKPRTRFGHYLDKGGISQSEFEKITGINKNTTTRLCNDFEYVPNEDILVRAIGALRRRGFDVRAGMFW